jgi:hypothetical protein
MLPLGLLLIAQDVPVLQKPLVTVLMWTTCKSLRAKWQGSTRGKKLGGGLSEPSQTD